MYLLTILFSCLVLFQINVFAELTSSSCALLRTGISLTTIVPEIAQLGMRYYHASTSQSRQKRFLRDTTPAKNGSTPTIKGTVVEQMMANTIRDVNFTNVALLLLNNSDSLKKLRTHVDQDAILRLVVRGVDYEKLIIGFMSAAESEFDLEHFIESILNKTRIDAIHDEILTNGTLPEWFIKSIHPNLTVQTVKQIFLTLKTVSEKFVKILSKSERFDNYLFNMLTQQALTPLNNILQNVKDEKPKTFDQLIKLVVNNVNKVALQQSTTNTKAKKPVKQVSGSTIAPVDLEDDEDVKLMLYQWSVAVDSMGQSVRIVLKSIEQLYCASVWQ